MGKNVINLIIVSLLLISLVGAVTYRASTDIDIRHSIRVNDAPTSTASCNITIFDPNFKILAFYRPMTFTASSQTYNYTLLAINDSQTGTYNYDVTCLDGAFNKTQSFRFDVSNNGQEYTISESLTYIFALILSIGLFCICLWGAITISPENMRNEDGYIMKINYKKHLKFFLGVVCYLILVWIFFVAWNISLAYLALDSVASFFWFIHRTLYVLMIPVGICYVLFQVISFVNDLRLSERIEKGFSVT